MYELVFGPNGSGGPNISGFFFGDKFLPSGAMESNGNLANLRVSPFEEQPLARSTQPTTDST
jgi:hypothetical protein